METPAINDTFNDLLWKLASNLYDAAVAGGSTAAVLPTKGSTDQELLKAAVINSSEL